MSQAIDFPHVCYFCLKPLGTGVCNNESCNLFGIYQHKAWQAKAYIEAFRLNGEKMTHFTVGDQEVSIHEASDQQLLEIATFLKSRVEKIDETSH